MNPNPTHTGACPRCGASWTFLPGSQQWLWKKRSGATHLLQEYGEVPASGPEPLTRCPRCKAKQPVGKARVEEVRVE
jgi:hypothetical protein